jgi:adenylate kinase family enzyme
MPTTGNIFVVGTSGSGKSTVAKRISAALGHKHVEIDALLWLPNWTQRDSSELAKLLQAELAQGRIVMDGNFATKGIAPNEGDVLIFLDYPRWRIISRLIRRSLARVILRKELWSGNREEFQFLISSDPEINPILHAFKTHSFRHHSYTKLLEESQHTSNHIIKNPKQLRKLLEAL